MPSFGAEFSECQRQLFQQPGVQVFSFGRSHQHRWQNDLDCPRRISLSAAHPSMRGQHVTANIIASVKRHEHFRLVESHLQHRRITTSHAQQCCCLLLQKSLRRCITDLLNVPMPRPIKSRVTAGRSHRRRNTTSNTFLLQATPADLLSCLPFRLPSRLATQHTRSIALGSQRLQAPEPLTFSGLFSSMLMMSPGRIALA